MRKLITILTAVVLAVALALAAGCGHDSTAPEPGINPAAWSLTIIEGNGARGVVAETFASPLGAQLLQSEQGQASAMAPRGTSGIEATVPVGFTAVPGQLLCFDVDPRYGRAAPQCSLTDSTGVAVTQIIAGEKAADDFPVIAYTTMDTTGDGTQEVVAVDTARLSTDPAPPTSIVLDVDTLVAFVGKAGLMRNHLVSATDEYGNAAPLSYLTVSADSPWAVAAPDTVRATSFGAGWLRVTGGTAADSIWGVAVADLSPYSWALDYACIGGAGVGLSDVDSMAVAFVTDSIVYGSARDTVPGLRLALAYGARANMYYRSDGTVDVQAGPAVVYLWQGGGFLLYDPRDATTTATADAYPPTAYDGGHRCTGWDSYRAATLTRQ